MLINFDVFIRLCGKRLNQLAASLRHGQFLLSHLFDVALGVEYERLILADDYFVSRDERLAALGTFDCRLELMLRGLVLSWWL